MSINTQKSRERIKRSTLTGVVPTVPVSSDFTDGTWLNTDIRAGEFFYNIPDEKLWIGTNTTPLELTSGIGNTLAQILLNGNTTGGSDIIITSTDLIKDSTGKTYIDLNTNNFKIMSDDNVNNREAQFNIVNDFGSGSIGVSMSAVDTTNNIYTVFTLDADTPYIQSQLTNTILSTYNSFNIGRHYTEVTNGEPAPSNPATDIFAFIDIFMIGTNKPNVVIGNNSPGLFEQAISLSHTGMTIYTDIELTMNALSIEIYTTSFFDLNGMYNGLTCNILRTADNFATPITTVNNQTSGIIIGSQNSTIAAGVYNSVIIGGVSNQILVGTGNIISGSGNTITSGSGNMISGFGNSITGSSCIISGVTNQNNGGDFNIITGDTNIMNATVSNSLLIGSNNTMTNNGIMFGDNGTIGSNGLCSVFQQTFNTTPELLIINGTSSGFKVDLDTSFRVKLTVLAINTSTGDTKEWKGFGIIKNIGGTTSLVSAITMTSTVGDDGLAAATVVVTANNTTDCLDITVTGVAASTINWNCGIDYVLVRK